MKNSDKLNLIKSNNKNKAGRPSKYEKRFIDMAFEIMSLGATMPKLAAILNVNQDTLYEWQKKYPELSESIQRGRDDWDSENVEKALKKRAMGFTYTEKTYEKPVITLIPGKDKAVQAELERQIDMLEPILVKEVKKYVAPSDQALQFWLKNRRPTRWPKNGDLSDAANTIIFTDAKIQDLLQQEKEHLSNKNLNKGESEATNE